MKRIWVGAALAAATLSGCDKAQSDDLIFVKAEGARLVAISGADTQFSADRKACIAMAEKAAVGLPAAYYQGLDRAITPAMLSDRNTRALVEIIKGCMTGKGYRLIPQSQAGAEPAAAR